jgi:hypothetical protein
MAPSQMPGERSPAGQPEAVLPRLVDQGGGLECLPGGRSLAVRGAASLRSSSQPSGSGRPAACGSHCSRTFSSYVTSLVNCR